MESLIIAVMEMTIGAIVCMGGLYLLAKQKFVKNSGQNSVEVVLPFIGRLKTNYPSLLALFIGAALVYHPSQLLLVPEAVAQELEAVNVRGKVAIANGNGDDYRRVQLYIVPSEYIRTIGSDGRFQKVAVPRQVQAAGVAIYQRRDGGHEIVVQGIDITGESAEAEFNVTFNGE